MPHKWPHPLVGTSFDPLAQTIWQVLTIEIKGNILKRTKKLGRGVGQFFCGVTLIFMYICPGKIW